MKKNSIRPAILYKIRKGIPDLLALLLFPSIVAPSYSELYIPGAWLSGADTNATLSSWTLPNEQGAGAWFSIAIDVSNPVEPILRPVPFSGTIGIGHFWYETLEDTVIDSSFAASASQFYNNADLLGGGGEIKVTAGQSFFLAFKLGKLEPNPWDVYGWAELMWDGSDLQLLDSAAENDGVGIIAGQYVQVPEPSSVLLLSMGAGGILFYRRAKRRQQEQHVSRHSFH